MRVERVQGLSCFGMPWLVDGRLFVPNSQDAHVVDLSAWPFRVRHLRTGLADAVPHPDGGWMLCGRPGGPREAIAWRCADREVVDPPPDVEGTRCDRLAAAGGEIYGLTATIAYDDAPMRLLRLTGGAPGPVEGIPASVGSRPTAGSGLFRGIGAVRLGDGSDVLFWDGDGWERDGDRWVRTFDLGARSTYEVALAADGADGFYYLDDRRPFFARRGAAPVRVLPWAENVMGIAPGPGGSLLLQFGRNDRALMLALAFPADGSMVPLKRKDLESPHVNELMHGFFWSEATDKLVSIGWGLVVLDAAEVLSRKRTRPKTK